MARRLSTRQRRLMAARAQIEADLAVAVYQEMVVLWRSLYPSLRRLAEQRPDMTLGKRRLRKATFAGAGLWEQFQQRLEQRLTAAIDNGTASLNDIHNAWHQYHNDGMYSEVVIEPGELVTTHRAEIGARIKNIADQTRRSVGRAVAEWYNQPGETLDDLVTTLQANFGESRAAGIASTETTWLNSAVVRTRMEKLGIDRWVWSTRRDEIVCRSCRERNGRVYHRDDPMPPEASHPRCRCSPVEVVDMQSLAGIQPKPASAPPMHLTAAPEEQTPPFLTEEDNAAIAAIFNAPDDEPLPETVPQPPSPPPPKAIGVKQYVEIKGKAITGQPVTMEELDAAEVFSQKTWKKGQPWISTAKDILNQPPLPPLTVGQYVALSQKAVTAHLTPQEMDAVESFALKTWGKPPAWLAGHKVGELKPPTPAKVKVKKPVDLSAPVVIAPEPPPPAPKPAWQTASGGLSHDALRQVDVHSAEPTWKLKVPPYKARYGAVLIDDAGNVLLREPKGHYDGYAWTFAKGGPDYDGEHPVDVVEREVREETGYEIEIVGIVPGGFSSGNSTSYFFLARAKSHNPGAMDSETTSTAWVTPEQAQSMIGQSTNDAGRQRDLAILHAAVNEDTRVKAGTADYSHVFAGITPPEPPKPVRASKPIQQRNLFVQQTGFPTSVQGLQVVQKLGGSTGASLVHDPETGARFVMKRGNNAGHILEEAYTDAVYQAAGAPVPAFQLYETPSGPVKLSAYLPNARALADAGPEERAKAHKKLQEHFAVDALVGNWDVIGMNADNILVDDAGNVLRIDNGGGLRTRAQGAPKGEAWNEHPTEIWTMRGAAREKTDPEIAGANGQAVNVFGDMSYREIGRQMRELAKKRDAILAAVPDDVREVLSKRLDTMEHLGLTQERMDESKWQEAYQDRFGRSVVEMRRGGITKRAPLKMTTKKTYGKWDVTVRDENGKPFDSLRGSGSLVGSVYTMIDSAGGNSQIIRDWLSGQAGDSWNDAVWPVKWWVSERRGSHDDYWWGEGRIFDSRSEGIDRCRKQYEAACSHYGGEEVFERTMRMYQAYTYEYLSKADYRNKNADGTVRLIRTESQKLVQSIDKAKQGDTSVKTRRGGCESTSILNPFSYKGSEIVLQNIRICDILATYWTSRGAGSTSGALAGDHENEFVAILGRTPYNYIGDDFQE